MFSCMDVLLLIMFRFHMRVFMQICNKKGKKGKNHFYAVKLGMMKTYDPMEWHFLEEIMLNFGFSKNTVRLIMKCVSSVKFTVRVNGKLLPYLTPTCGLRQDDPISPNLFLFCAEGFTSLLNSFCGNYVDEGIRVSVKNHFGSRARICFCPNKKRKK